MSVIKKTLPKFYLVCNNVRMPRKQKLHRDAKFFDEIKLLKDMNPRFETNFQVQKDISKSNIFTLESANKLIHDVIMKKSFLAIELYDKTVKQFAKVSSIELDEKLWGIRNLFDVQVRKLGAIPEGLGIVDFDAGYGRRFCWKYYPLFDVRHEPNIMYWHFDGDGFSNRIPIEYFITLDLPSETPQTYITH